jgi:peptidyl-prolyl cis-trans isomerase SurA
MKHLHRHIKLYFTIILLLISSVLTTAYADQNLDGIVAIVNDGVITQSQLNQQITIYKQQMLASHAPMPPMDIIRNKVLQHMIDEQLQLQVAKKAGIKIDDATLNQTVAKIAAQNGITVDVLKNQITQQGMSYDQYRAEIRKEMILSQVEQHEIAPRVTITDQEVTDYLNTHHNQIALPASQNPTQSQNVFYHIENIIIPLPDSPTSDQVATAQKAAEQMLAQLKAGADFKKITLSALGQQVNAQENDLGWRAAQQVPTLYLSRLQALSAGGIIGPIRAPNGFHIIKLDEMRGQQATPSLQQSLQQNLQETHVQHILIKTTPLEPDLDVKARLERLRAGILAGTTSFAEAAKENSQDPGSVNTGGDIGWTTSAVLDPTFAQVMNQTKIGDISQPFKSQFGWHILQVLGRRTTTDKQSLLRAEAREVLYQKKFNEALQSWLQTLRSSGYVKVM